MEFYIFKSQEVIERQTSKFDQSTISFPLPKELKEGKQCILEVLEKLDSQASDHMLYRWR